MENLITLLTKNFADLEFKKEEKLAQYTTVKIGGPAEVFCEIKDSDVLKRLISFAIKNEIKYTILGWGANTLISDQGIRGLVIKNSAQKIEVLENYRDESGVDKQESSQEIDHRWHADNKKGSFKYEFSDLDYDESDQPEVFVKIDSGVSLPFAINHLINMGITGLQWYARIPATLGGAIYNNIHGGTHFISEVIESVEVVDEYGKINTLTNQELSAGYDTSRFHHTNEVIVSAILKLRRGDEQKAKEVATQWAVRKAVQPQKSLGCVFQNIDNETKERLDLPTTSVGYIVDHILNKKNFRIGDAMVSDKHAAFIENVGNASAKDYLEIIKTIILETKEKTGVELKPEIFFLGFDKNELVGVTH